eukprot:scaffold71848_cov34-Attheya_sp.AAC.1
MDNWSTEVFHTWGVWVKGNCLLGALCIVDSAIACNASCLDLLRLVYFVHAVARVELLPASLKVDVRLAAMVTA